MKRTDQNPAAMRWFVAQTAHMEKLDILEKTEVRANVKTHTEPSHPPVEPQEKPNN